MKHAYKFFLFLLLLLPALVSEAQVRITGKVTDAKTGEGLPFVSVYVKNTTLGTSTDLDGSFTLRLATAPDSLTVSYVGFVMQTKAVKRGVPAQVINFSLQPTSLKLQELVVRPSENPAFRIMRQVMAHKTANDKRRLTAYQYEGYTRMQFFVDNVEGKKKKLGLRSVINSLVDSSKYLTDEEGQRVLPVFMSESLSDFYYNREPRRVKEIIRNTSVTGVGIQDGNLMAQLLGSSFQDYNFYQNWVSVMRKDFISPIAEGWKGSYHFELEDSLFVGDTWCYQLKVEQKRAQDLAFNGRIWIADGSFALRKIDVTVSKSANINFVEGIHLVQESQPTAVGAWLPAKTAVTMRISPMSENRPRVIARIYTSGRNPVVNVPQPASFFDQPLEVVQKANTSSREYWDLHRPDSLSVADKQVYETINAIVASPRVARFSKTLTFLGTGYKKAGMLNVGPWPYTYAFNNIEGHRLEGGFKTNIDFSDKWELSGWTAYGTLDQRVKYGATARYIISRRRWSEAGISRREDLQQVGLMSDRLGASPYLMAFSRLGELRRPIFTKETNAYYQSEVLRGVTQRLTLRNRMFSPEYTFGYYTQQGRGQEVAKDFTATELSYAVRIAKNEVFVQNDNERISLGNESRPALTFKYTLGLNDVLGANLDYHRLDLGLSQQFLMGRLGKTLYRVEAGKIFNPVPYPLLEAHLGNQTPFYFDAAFNLMNYFEFASDTYASLHYEQYFEGLLLNRLPLIKKLKWRVLASSNVLYGNLSPANLRLISPTGTDGNPQASFKGLGPAPYVEVGYGIENIFRFLRVDAFHRLTYLDDPAVKKFGLRFSVQLKL
ncbi:DUF5686 and carboxypeptidase-like regulatory domain-containing protein [soil metagenome]